MSLGKLCSNVMATVLCLVLAWSFVPMAALADEGTTTTFSEGGLAYTVIGAQSVEVGVQAGPGNEYAGAGDVVVPASVTHDGVTYEVTGIGAYAFSDGAVGADVTSLTIAEGVRSIGARAFTGCDRLQSISIPVSVAEIGNFAFANCPNLHDIAFQQLDAPSPALVCGQGTFSSGIDAANTLESIELPCRLSAVAPSMFQRQTALKTLKFAGDAVGSIGQYAFNACVSLEYIEIPALTKAGKLGTGAFYELPQVKEVVFKGDIDYNLPNEFLGIEVIEHNVSYMDVVDYYRYPDVKTVVFNGKRAGYTMSKAFEGADQYQRIAFYQSATAVEPQSWALVNVDVAARDVTSGLDASMLYAGSIPDLPADMSWYFAGTSPNQPIPDSCSTYPVGNASLAYGSIVLESSELATIDEPVVPSFVVFAPNGDEIARDALAVTYADASGRTVAEADLVDPGTYTVTVTSTNGRYTGSLSAQFSITRAQSAWARLDGSAYYALGNHVVGAAFDQASCDTAVLVPRSALAEGAAVAALAGAYHAPIIVANDNVSETIDADADQGHLNAEARYSLALLKPNRVILVGFTRTQRDDAQAFVRKVLPQATYPTFSNTADDIAAAALSVYDISKKMNTTGITVKYGETAIVANAANLGYAYALMPFAYRELSPLFLSLDGSSLSDDAVKDLVSDGFTRVILAGPSSVVSKGIEKQLKAAGFTGNVTRWGDDDEVDRASRDIAEAGVASGVLGYDGLVVASPDDGVTAVMSAAVCGEAASTLVLSGADDAASEATCAFVKQNLGAIKHGYVAGTRSFVPESLLEDIRALWTSGLAGDLYAGGIALKASTLPYTGEAAVPRVTVRDASGAVLPAGAYTLSYYDNATDRQVSADAIVEPGSYSVTAQGAGSYSGARSADFSVSVQKGATIKEGPVTYKATSTSALQVVKVSSAASGALILPASVKGLAVTSIGDQAFKGCAKLTELTVKSTKLTGIGAKAFQKCSKLKSMKFRSKKITNVGSKAFSKINANVRVSVPSSKVKAYQKLFAKAGLPATATVKKG